MKVEMISSWNIEFFESFKDFKNLIHKDIVTSFPEELNDYSKYFGAESHFLNDYQWRAFSVRKGERIVAQAILSWRKNSKTGNLGFLDWENDLSAATELIRLIKEEAKKHELNLIKTPVDLNFFVKYRIRVPGGDKPFWGEPIYPDYYHELFQKTGFSEIGRWDTYRLFKLQGIIDYFRKRQKLAVKKDGAHSNTRNKNLRTTIRCVNLSDWENELRIIHSLFNQAYQNMPEFEPISFEQFKVIYDDFRYIMNPLYSYIVELRGKPVGFSINFVDPLPVLKKVKGKKLSTVQKALLLAKLRLNNSTYIIAHVGKIPGPNGEEIKGVQIQASRRIQFAGVLMRKVLVSFQMKGSPSRRSFEEKSQVTYAEYVLYGMSL